MSAAGSNASFSVVIATHNRKHLVGRAIQSALRQQGGPPEIIVLDDASHDGTAQFVASSYPTIRLHRLEENRGPGRARDLGLEMARGRWVVILDDDDELNPDALTVISARLAELPDADRYPAFHFRHGNGSLDAPYRLIRLPDFWGAGRHGDFIPVWNREVALREGYRYPDTPLGAEALVWLLIADRVGIPTWADGVGVVHADAGSRLTGVEAQVANAVHHVAVQERILALLQPHERVPSVRRLMDERRLAAGLYAVLAGEDRRAIGHAMGVLIRRPGRGLALLVFAALPRSIVVWLFRRYRSRQAGQ